MQDYVLIIHSAEEGGYWAEIPALPGCFVQGETIDELLAETRDAKSLAGILLAMRLIDHDC